MSSWFHHTKTTKLRRNKPAAGAIATADLDPDDATPPPPPSPCSPNRASYYVPSRDRRALPRRAADNPKLRDTGFPPRSPRAGDLVFDVVARRPSKAAAPPPAGELRLRPILTRAEPDDDGDGGSAGVASPTARARTRFHAPTTTTTRKAEDEGDARGRRRRRADSSRLRWVYDSLVVVKESADPEEDFLDSVAEMIAANEAVRSPRGLQDLLACYLALNAAEHHRAIVAAFRRAWALHLRCGRCAHQSCRG